MTNKAHVTISRVSTSECPYGVALKVVDKNSKLTIAESTIPMDEFGKLFISEYGCEADLTIAPSHSTVDNIGKHKLTKAVALPWDEEEGLERLHELIEPHLCDGWAVDDIGLEREQTHGSHIVRFRRFVDEKQNEEG